MASRQTVVLAHSVLMTLGEIFIYKKEYTFDIYQKEGMNIFLKYLFSVKHYIRLPQGH